MSDKLSPFIWIETPIDEVFEYYSKIFEKSQIHFASSFTGTIEIFGQKLIFLNGGPHFKLSPAFSLMIHCENQEETDYYWDAITKDGETGHCGWCVDKFGVSWQVTPRQLNAALSDPDQEIATFAHNAMMKMNKIIIKDLFPLGNAPN